MIKSKVQDILDLIHISDYMSFDVSRFKEYECFYSLSFEKYVDFNMNS